MRTALAQIPSWSTELQARKIEKPWGRTELPPPFGNAQGRRIGEIWLEDPAGGQLPLLAKYIFTSEKLSVQVHPDDQQAHARGLSRGKSECWYILGADDGAEIGIGLTKPLSPAELRASALDGSIEHLLEWKPVARGDFIYVPAGTIHAVRAGIALLEFQQNADVTYRLYDYGRPRELHLDDGAAVANPSYDWSRHFRPAGGPIDAILVNGPHFSLVRSSSSGQLADLVLDRLRWVVPLEGTATADGVSVGAGGGLLVEQGVPLSLEPSSVILMGAEGTL
jgi:mannose-6-phosphate isomerase